MPYENRIDLLETALKEKDERAFAYIYDHYKCWLLSYVTRLLGKEEAADAMQEIFIRIYEGIGTFDPEKARITTWMLNISKNYCIDLIRRRKTAKHLHIARDSDRLLLDTKDLPPDTDDITMLRARIHSMAEPYQKIFILKYVYGFTDVQVADQLGMPLGSVKTRLIYGKDILKSYFVPSAPQTHKRTKKQSPALT